MNADNKTKRVQLIELLEGQTIDRIHVNDGQGIPCICFHLGSGMRLDISTGNCPPHEAFQILSVKDNESIIKHHGKTKRQK